MTDHMTFRELIEKHHYHRKHNIKYEFSDLLITGDNEEIEADLSGLRISNSTFSGVNFTKIKLPKGRLSNVGFVEASHLTFTICKGPGGQNPPSLVRPLSALRAISFPQSTIPKGNCRKST